VATNVDDVLAILAGGVGAGFQSYVQARKEREQEAYERAMRERLETARETQRNLENERARREMEMRESAEKRDQALYEAGQPEREFHEWYYKPQVPQGAPWGIPVPSPRVEEYRYGQEALREKGRLAGEETQAQIREREAHERLYGAQAAYYGRRPGTTAAGGAKPPNPQAQINTLGDDNRAINTRRQQLRKDYPLEALTTPVEPDEVDASEEYKQLGADLLYNMAEVGRLRKEIGQAPETKPTGNITDELITEFAKYPDKQSALADYHAKKGDMEGRGADVKRIRKSIEKRFK